MTRLAPARRAEPRLTLSEVRRTTRVLPGHERLAVFDRLPVELQEGAWDALAADWADHRHRDWRDVQDQGVAA